MDSISFKYPDHQPKAIILGMDSCFYGHEFGVTVFRDIVHSKNIYWRFVIKENQDMYIDGIDYLLSQGWSVKAIVSDGKNLSLGKLFNIPIQMCQFHQLAIIKRYLTSNPKLLASIQLKQIAELLPKIKQDSFQRLLDVWYFRWSDFLAEKTPIPNTKHWFYTHKRIRSAYRSLRTNLPYLFTYQRLKKLGIRCPNTNNSLEGTFAHLKDKVRLHRGLKLNRKLKLINQILAGIAPEKFH